MSAKHPGVNPWGPKGTSMSGKVERRDINRNSEGETERREAIYERLGKFRISQRAVLEHKESVAKAMSGMVVVRCESRFDTNSLEYVAWSPNFRKIAEGEMPPVYDLIVDVKHQENLSADDLMPGAYVSNEEAGGVRWVESDENLEERVRAKTKALENADEEDTPENEIPFKERSRGDG